MSTPDLETTARLAKAALEAGRSSEDVIAELISKGIRDADARHVVGRLRFAQAMPGDEAGVARRMSESYRKMMVGGAALLVAGAGFTIYSVALSGGSQAWIAWGAIFAGLAFFIHGFLGWIRTAHR